MLVLVLVLIVGLVVLIVVLPIVIIIFICAVTVSTSVLLPLLPGPSRSSFPPIIPVAVALFISAILFFVVILCLHEVCKQLLKVSVAIIVLFLVILRLAPSH